MKERIKKAVSNPLFSGSLLMVVGSNLASFLSYVYHFAMGRLLGPAHYGDLAALISLLGILGILPTILSTVVIKFISSSRSQDQVRDLTKWLDRKAFFIAAICGLIVILTSPSVATFLNISDVKLIIITALIFFFSFLSMFNRSVLQGVLKFKETVLSYSIENVAKLLFGVILVYLGFSINGAIWGLLLAIFIGWLASKKYSDYYKRGTLKNKPNIRPILFYSLPVFIQSITTVSFISTDLLLVKHFFSPHDVGIYAALSNLGKIIYFGAAPIAAVMFPLISKKQGTGDSYKKIFLASLFFTLLLSAGILAVYLFLPNLSINILYGPLFLEAQNYLFFFGIFASLYTLAALFINFHLSLGNTKVVMFPFIAAMVQVLGIWFFHNSLQTVITVSLLDMACLLGLLVAFSFIKTQSRMSSSI